MVLRVDSKFLIQTTNGPMRFRYDKINKKMARMGLTPDQVGALCGLPGNTIKRARDGKNITMDTFLRIAHSLDIRPDLLLKENFKFRRAVNRAGSMNGVDLSGSGSAR